MDLKSGLNDMGLINYERNLKVIACDRRERGNLVTDGIASLAFSKLAMTKNPLKNRSLTEFQSPPKIFENYFIIFR